MNILFFVTAFLIILSFLSYARIDTYRSFLGTQAEFERYMNGIERKTVNQVAKDWYVSTYAKRKGNPRPDEAPPPLKPNPDGSPPAPSAAPSSIAASSPRLSFRYFVDEDMRKAHPQAYTQMIQWAKNLMTQLYGHQLFFKEAEAQNPGFLDDLLENLGRAAAALPKEQKLKDASDLSTLELRPELETPFYYMLKGCPREEAEIVQIPPPIPTSNISAIDDTNQDDEEDSSEEAKEYTLKKGYDSLLNYITLRNTTKIRVYLASVEVLQTIFGNKSIADNIIQTRYELYRGVMNHTIKPEDASAQLKAQFQGYLNGNDDLFLDFKVTKTNPTDYN